MKKILMILVAAIAIMCPDGAKAQFRYGPTAGINMSELRFKQNLFTVDRATGLEAGIQGEMMFPGIGFGVDIGLLYSMQGAKLHMGQKEIWASQGIGDPRCYLHYAQIPVHLRFKWTRMGGIEEYVAPFVSFGPSMSVLVGHSSNDALSYAGACFGFECGLGLEIMRHWQVQCAYEWGLTYSLKTKLLDEFSARNRLWSVRVTYLF